MVLQAHLVTHYLDPCWYFMVAQQWSEAKLASASLCGSSAVLVCCF